MNKKIAMSAISIVTALSLMGGATFAAFSDVATSTGNTFSTGNADLQIAEDTGTGPGDFSDQIGGADFSGLFPGFDDRFLFWLKNNSTSAIDLNLTSDIAALVNDPSDGTLQDNLLVSWICDTSGNGGLEDGDTETGEFSVKAWFEGGTGAIGSLEPGEQMICSMQARIPDSADDSIAGEDVNFNAVYNAVQTP